MAEEIQKTQELPQLVQVQNSISKLFPAAGLELTAEEEKSVQIYQTSSLILGAARSAVMKCAGELCPIKHTCPLFQINKHPMGQLCPLEANYVTVRFSNWIIELGKDEASLGEAERAQIAELVVIDLQEKRCLEIMAEGKMASMTDLSVKEVDLQTGDALSYEKIVHANQQILTELSTRRRMILDDMEKTEKARTRKQKAQMGKTGKDLSSRQSANADKVRKALDVLDIK